MGWGYDAHMAVQRMDTPKFHQTEVWAQLLLCDEDCSRISDFLLSALRVKRSCVVRRMHITVYHARRPMPNLLPISEAICLVVPPTDTRFMVLAPGGENPRPELEPGRLQVGIRILKKSAARTAILEFRKRLLQHETQRVLGTRAPSTDKRSAFGARNFQPHMALLKAGSGIERDLTPLGAAFRRALADLTFDKFVVEIGGRNAGRRHATVPADGRV